jgi:hypothetical protein
MRLAANRRPRVIRAFLAGFITTVATLLGAAATGSLVPAQPARLVTVAVGALSGALVALLVASLVESLTRRRGRVLFRTRRAAYLKRLKELHAVAPNPADVQERLKVINAAYQRLKDYDRFRKAGRRDVSVRFVLLLFARRAGRERPAIEAPPGMRLNRLAQLLPKRAYDRVLKPCLAEMQEEYCAALQAGDERAAKRAQFWGTVAFWCHVLGLIPESIVRMVLKLRT